MPLAMASMMMLLTAMTSCAYLPAAATPCEDLIAMSAEQEHRVHQVFENQFTTAANITNAADEAPSLALFRASYRGYANVVAEIIQHCPLITESQPQLAMRATILFWMARRPQTNSDEAIAHLLVNPRPASFHRDRLNLDRLERFSGMAILHLAAGRGNQQLVGVLLQAKANLEVKERGQGETALVVAVRYAKVHVVEMLLGAGANPNATNSAGQSALHVAQCMVHLHPDESVARETVRQLLIAQGADEASIDWDAIALAVSDEQKTGFDFDYDHPDGLDTPLNITHFLSTIDALLDEAERGSVETRQMLRYPLVVQKFRAIDAGGVVVALLEQACQAAFDAAHSGDMTLIYEQEVFMPSPFAFELYQSNASIPESMRKNLRRIGALIGIVLNTRSRANVTLGISLNSLPLQRLIRPNSSLADADVRDTPICSSYAMLSRSYSTLQEAREADPDDRGVALPEIENESNEASTDTWDVQYCISLVHNLLDSEAFRTVEKGFRLTLDRDPSEYEIDSVYNDIVGVPVELVSAAFIVDRIKFEGEGPDEKIKRVLAEPHFQPADRRALLLFVTGTSRIPIQSASSNRVKPEAMFTIEWERKYTFGKHDEYLHMVASTCSRTLTVPPEVGTMADAELAAYLKTEITTNVADAPDFGYNTA